MLKYKIQMTISVKRRDYLLNKEKICYLFGQHEAPLEKQSSLYQVIENLIKNQNVRYFIFGNQGAFDRIALFTLRQLKKIYPFICYNVILAYYPVDSSLNILDATETIFPAELATIPKRFAIWHRNTLMLKQADFVVCYVPYSFGNSAKLLAMAQKSKKNILQI